VHSSRVPTVLAASQQRLLLLLASLDTAVLGVLGKAMKLSVQLKSRGLPGQGHEASGVGTRLPELSSQGMYS
jgi:hypothetical protein